MQKLKLNVICKCNVRTSCFYLTGELVTQTVKTSLYLSESFKVKDISSPPSLLVQVTGKRSEGKESDGFQGGVYEAAVNQEKQDDRRSHRELVDGGLSEEGDSGNEQEEVSVAALNVRTRCGVCPWDPRHPLRPEIESKHI